MERLQKIIANSGYCSRRKAEELIEKGKVKINEKIAKLGDKASEEDKICIDNILIQTKLKNFYYILNKPKGILVTKEDPKNRKTIYHLPSLVKLKEEIKQNLNYVGRLDGMSEGLLILTNDGKLNNSLTHPKHHIGKTYQVRTEPSIKKQDIEKLERGLLVEERKLFAKISNQKENTFDITISEGRNRIIRKSLEKLNYKIFQLKRISIENIKLGNLKEGQIRKISSEELKTLQNKITA